MVGDASRLQRIDVAYGPNGGADPFAAWAVDACERVLLELQRRRTATTGLLEVVVVATLGPVADAWAAAAAHAAVEGLRGAMHSLTPEWGGEAKVNLVVAPAGAEALVAETLDYIASPGGAYVAGSTFDLRETA